MSSLTWKERIHVFTGKVPNNKPGDQYNEMRHYVCDAMLAPDRLLIAAGGNLTYTPGEEKNKIFVPHNVAPGLLYHLHNKRPGQHPSMMCVSCVGPMGPQGA